MPFVLMPAELTPAATGDDLGSPEIINDTDGVWAKQFRVEAYPTTFIYNPEGELKFTDVGYTSTAGLLARFEWIK